jgi:basic membrane protein A and related proteins
LPPTQLTTPPSESQGILLPPTQLATPSSPPVEARPRAFGAYSTDVRSIPQPKKGPKVGLLIGMAILLIALISGSFYAFTRGVSSNSGNTNSNGSTAATNTGRRAAPAVNVALVTDVGGLNDGGFNQFSFAGYEKARAQYGFPDVVIQSQVISDSEYTKKITQAAQKADMVIGVGFLMQNAIYTVAKQYPNKKFALIDGCATNPTDTTGACVNLPNVAPLFFNEQQAGCLVGAIAGQMELDGKAKLPKLLGKNTIGAVGGLAIPPVVRYIAGYKYCAQKVDPNVNVVVGYSNNFTDPTKCAAIVDNSADILFQVAGGCGIGVLDSATKHNVYSIGVDVDQSKDSTGATRPSVITSAIKRIDTAAYSIINMAETGTYASFVANPSKFDITNNGVGYATPSADVPQDAIQKAMEFANDMKSGSLTPPEVIP